MGSGDRFQVDTNGDMVKIRNVTSSWPSAQAGGAGFVLANNGSGTLSWTTVAAAGNAFVQNGNSFTANAVLGTNDNDTLAFETNGTTLLTLGTDGHLLPLVHDTYDLGGASNRFRGLYLGAGSLHIGTSASA